MLKIVILLGFFFLLTALIWALGLRQDEEAILKYLVFASQLLYGSLVYDILKTMRAIPYNDGFWVSASKIAANAAAWIVLVVILLILATKVFFLAYVGLIGAIIVYINIFVRVLPKLQPLYIEAQNRVQKLPSQTPETQHRIPMRETAKRRPKTPNKKYKQSKH